MDDFDRAKDLANVAKHGISLARWSDMKIRAIAPMDSLTASRIA